MATMQDPAIAQTARDGAASVFRYVARTAEVVPGGVRWRTLSDANEPQYDAGLGDGVAGIALFLTGYYRATGDPQARTLAEGACRWCAAPERRIEGMSLMVGWAGIGLAWLHLARATARADALAEASAIAGRLQARGPGPVTTLYSGAAGEGIFLLRLAEASGEAQHLAAARRWGDWLAEVAVRKGPGVYWPYEVEEEPWIGLGLGPGAAGTGGFLAALYQATREARYAELVRGAARTLIDQARPDHGGLNWAQTLDEPELQRCQLCDGSPGIGLFFARAYEALGEPTYLDVAAAAGQATYAYGDVRHNAGQCHGLAGNGELLLELYRLTREPVWLARAGEFARQALAYRTAGAEGDIWQADEPGYSSPEFLNGAAGTGHFFLRLADPDAMRIAYL